MTPDVTIKTDNIWRWLERIIFMSTILIGVIFYVRDNAVDRAMMASRLEQLEKNQDEMLNKMQEFERYWRRQNEINGRIIQYLDLDVHE